jgi:hypothetical protein
MHQTFNFFAISLLQLRFGLNQTFKKVKLSLYPCKLYKITFKSQITFFFFLKKKKMREFWEFLTFLLGFNEKS